MKPKQMGEATAERLCVLDAKWKAFWEESSLELTYDKLIAHVLGYYLGGVL